MRPAKYARIGAIFAGASVSAQMEYRANFVVALVGALLEAGGVLFGLWVLYGDGQPLGGWSLREALVIVGVFTLVDGFIGAFLRPNLNKIAEGVRTGTMDFQLIKPIDAQFLVSARSINVFALPHMLLGLGVIAWAASGIAGVTLGGIALGAGLVAAGLAIVYSVWFMLSTTAFWFVKVENVTELFNSVFRAGQFPITALPGWTRVFFTFFVPVAFITTVPAEAIVGRARPTWALGAVLVAAAFLVASRLFWRFAVGRYTSASS